MSTEYRNPKQNNNECVCCWLRRKRHVAGQRGFRRTVRLLILPSDVFILILARGQDSDAEGAESSLALIASNVKRIRLLRAGDVLVRGYSFHQHVGLAVGEVLAVHLRSVPTSALAKRTAGDAASVSQPLPQGAGQLNL